MSDKSNEQISNLMDGELEINASKFLLKRMAADKSLSKKWESYHLIKSCLQKETTEPLVVDVASRVSQELGFNNHQIEPEKVHSNRWLKPILGIGIAASVAFMSVFMIQNQKIEGVEPTLQPVIAKVVDSSLQPIKPNLSVNMANSTTSIVPPPTALSRFPSVSQKGMVNYYEGFSQNVNTPYLIIINQVDGQSKKVIKSKNISD